MGNNKQIVTSKILSIVLAMLAVLSTILVTKVDGTNASSALVINTIVLVIVLATLVVAITAATFAVQNKSITLVGYIASVTVFLLTTVYAAAYVAYAAQGQATPAAFTGLSTTVTSLCSFAIIASVLVSVFENIGLTKID